MIFLKKNITCIKEEGMMKQSNDKKRRIQEERDRDEQNEEEYDEHVLKIMQKNLRNWERRAKKREQWGYRE